MRSRSRLTLLFFFLVIIGSLIIAIWQYHQMIIAIYDGASAAMYRRLMRPFATGGDSIGQKPIRVALWHSDLSAEAAGISPRAFEAWVRFWERFCANEGFACRRLAGERLDAASLAEFNVLVLPTAVAMSDDEMEAVKRFLRAGHGVILHWATGTRDERGSWRESSLLQQVCGLELTGPIPESERPEFSAVLLSARSPLTLGLSAAQVIWLARYDGPLAARVLEPRTDVAGFWTPDTRWKPQPRSAPQEAAARAVIAHGSYLGGRFVWFGFPPTAPLRLEQQRAVTLLMRNAVAWASRQPIAWKRPWREDVSGAFVLSWSLDQPNEYDERLPALVRPYGIRLTSFVSRRLLEEAPELARRLAGHGPIGLWISEAEAAAAPSLEALIRARERVAAVNEGYPVGVRFPSDPVPDAWLEAFVRSGYAYLSTLDYSHLLPQVIRTHRRVPVFVRERELWQIPEIRWADIAATARGRLAGAVRLETIAQTVAEEGGLLHVTFQPDEVTPELLQQLEQVFTHAHRARIWITDMVDVLRFYQVWGHLRVSTTYPTPARSAIQISNTGARYSGDLAVFILVDKRYSSLDITPTTIASPPVHAFSEDGVVWRFDLARIPPGKNYLYHLMRPETP